FVCGEETALIASLEGERGMPRKRPPFPAIKGFNNRPTIINNVETLANLPWIIRHGPQSFAERGTEKSKGTKVFALAGSISQGGLVEVNMGTPLKDVIALAGPTKSGLPIKAIQLGGPSGGCIPASLFDTIVDYQAISATGSIMGSGGMIILDEGTCMVDLARFFLTFTSRESCGKCTFCRQGTPRMLEILERICNGEGQMEDLDLLEELAEKVRATSLCGLGQTAPNPVLTTLKYFRSEYEAHIKEHRCPAHQCAALIKMQIDAAKCIGCNRCAQVCPAQAIRGQFKQKGSYRIDPAKCIRCGACLGCPKKAIEVV
ncbi:MAG: 4Fe-4S binding protein, partial [Bacteriovoracaceae bacterium]|nr:4Fe-4S binding protein [Bacteriovoracaceae bacterium]